MDLQNNTSSTSPVSENVQPDVHVDTARRDLQEPIPTSPSAQTFIPEQPMVSQPPVNFSTHLGGQSIPPPIDHLDEEKSNLPKIIKILVGLIVVGLIGFILFGLILPNIGKTSSSQVTLTWWGLWDDSQVMQPVINDFERSNPTIKINYVKQDPTQYSERLLTRIQNGTGPDIFLYHNSWLPMISPVLLPLPSSVITPDEFKKTFYPVIQSDVTSNGAIYGIPMEVDTLVLYTNDALFTAAGVKVPTNWTDFISAARALTVKDTDGKIKTAGAALGTADNITHAPDIVALLFAQNGAKMDDLSSTSQNASDALSFYTSFANDQGNVWDATLEPSLTAFAKGNLAMYFGYSYDYFSLKAMNPALQFTVNPVPHLPGRAMTIASYWVAGVSNKSTHQKEALLFMKYLAQKETAQKIYAEEAKTRQFGQPYARIDLADTLKDNPVLSVVLSQAKDTVSSIFTDNPTDTGINAQMNGYLGNAVRAVLSSTSPQTAIDTLAKGVAQVLQQYNTSNGTK